jgi:uncharacterized protein HemY
MMKKLFTQSLLVAGMSLSVGFSTASFAQEAEAKAAPPAPIPPVVCPGYKPGTTQIVGERAGKKVARAFEAYNEDLVDEALEILIEIDPSDSFDRAYVSRFIGNIMATLDNRGQEAKGYLVDAVKQKELNDNEHAGTLRLLGDLSLQEKDYADAINWYNKWMDFTCKEDADIYTRIAQAFYETKQLDKIIAPADKAIALYEKPNKNPYVLKLTSYYERKLYPQTVKVAEELVRQFPDNKQWWSQLGFFYMLVEDFPRALSTFEMAYAQGYLVKVSEIKALAQLYATSDIPHKAALLLEKYINNGLLEKTESNYSQLANAFHSAKYHAKAASYYGIAAAINNDADLYRKQGVLLLAAEDYKGAVTALNNALEAGPEDEGRVQFALMEANFYQNKFRTAYKHAMEAKKHSSVRRNANAWAPYIKEKAKNRGISI